MSIWTGELSVGNRVIDSEHKKLHDVINRVKHLVAAKNVAALAEAFEQLESGLHACFDVEERVARAIDFDFTQHRLAHQHMLGEVRHIRSGLEASNCACPDGEDYVRCLKDCLIRHIKEEGHSLKVVLDTYWYDFNP